MEIFAMLAAYIGLHVANVLLIKLPVDQGLSPGLAMAVRGGVCLLVLGVWHWGRWKEFRPKRIGFQMFRLFWAGLSLCLLFSSLRYVHGSTLAMLSKLDIAWLILLGALVGEERSGSQKILASFALLLSGAYAISGGAGAESPLGYGLAFLATLGLAIGFLLLKKSSEGETRAVTIGVPALAILLYGGVAHGVTGGVTASWSAWAMAGLSGLVMVGLYETTLWFYRRTTVAEAEMPTLIAALLVLPFEHVLRGTSVSLSYLGFLVGLGFTLAWIIKVHEVSQWVSRFVPSKKIKSSHCSP